VIDPFSFAGEGWPAVLQAAISFSFALVTLAWLRGPGSRPHDPPVAHRYVRGIAGFSAYWGGLWLVRAVAGMGGFLVISGVALVVSLAYFLWDRARQS
jgi:hypothetical protein